MGIGVVIRDYTGSCLASCGEYILEIIIPELAEALEHFQPFGLPRPKSDAI
jgi:hypothetical protein